MWRVGKEQDFVVFAKSLDTRETLGRNEETSLSSQERKRDAEGVELQAIERALV
jgi:hypothetical protein